MKMAPYPAFVNAKRARAPVAAVPPTDHYGLRSRRPLQGCQNSNAHGNRNRQILATKNANTKAVAAVKPKPNQNPTQAIQILHPPSQNSLINSIQVQSTFNDRQLESLPIEECPLCAMALNQFATQPTPIVRKNKLPFQNLTSRRLVPNSFDLVRVNIESFNELIRKAKRAKKRSDFELLQIKKCPKVLVRARKAFAEEIRVKQLLGPKRAPKRPLITQQPTRVLPRRKPKLEINKINAQEENHFQFQVPSTCLSAPTHSTPFIDSNPVQIQTIANFDSNTVQAHEIIQSESTFAQTQKTSTIQSSLPIKALTRRTTRRTANKNINCSIVESNSLAPKCQRKTSSKTKKQSKTANAPKSGFIEQSKTVIKPKRGMCTRSKTKTIPNSPPLQHDPCCRQCHDAVTSSTGEHCSICPLSYHKNCISKSKLFQMRENVVKLYDSTKSELKVFDNTIKSLQTRKNVCDPCVLKMVSEVFNQTECGFAYASSFKDDVYQTYELLIKALIGMKTLKQFVNIQIPAERKALIFQDMDLSIMKEKMKSEEYKSLDDVMHDINTMIHNTHICSGKTRKLQVACQRLKDLASAEMEMIRKCESCYRISNIITKNEDMPETDFYVRGMPRRPNKDTAMFNLPCHTPHTVVWVKMEDKKFWPAKLFQHCQAGQFEADKELVSAQTFGTLKKKVVKLTECRTYSRIPLNGNTTRLTVNQMKAIREADHYLSLLDKRSFDDYEKPASSRLMTPSDDIYIQETDESKNKLIPTANANDQAGKKVAWQCYNKKCSKKANRQWSTIMRSYCSLACKKFDLSFKI